MPKAEPMIEFVPVNFDELARKYKKGRVYVLGAVHRFLRRTGQLLTPQVKAETPVGATGKLRRSTVFQVMGQAEDMRVEIRQSAFSPAGFPYGKAVRTGTRPHFPPPSALVPWVVRKLGVAEAQAAKVAFAIAVKISKVGTKANPYHIRVYRANLERVIQIAHEEMVRAATELHDIPPTGVS